MNVPNVFSTKDLRSLIITYDGSALIIYVDGIRSSHVLELNPGTIFFSSFSRLNKYNITVYNILYYAIIFIPLGILMTLTIKKMTNRFAIKILMILGGIMLPSLILEGILVVVSGRVVSLENLLIGIMFTSIPLFLMKYATPYIVGEKTGYL